MGRLILTQSLGEGRPIITSAVVYRHVHGFATEVQVQSQGTLADVGGTVGALEFRHLLNYQ